MTWARRVRFFVSGCTLVLAVGVAPAHADPPDCPEGTQILTYNDSLTSNVTTSHAVDLLPCETVVVELSMELVRYNPNNPASGSVIVQFWGMLPNGSDNLLFGYTVVCTDA